MATEYIVLQVTEGATGSVSDSHGKAASWREIGRTPAASAKAAVSAIASGTQTSDKLEGTFVAVPARSWQPVTVKVETALKFST